MEADLGSADQSQSDVKDEMETELGLPHTQGEGLKLEDLTSAILTPQSLTHQDSLSLVSEQKSSPPFHCEVQTPPHQQQTSKTDMHDGMTRDECSAKHQSIITWVKEALSLIDPAVDDFSLDNLDMALPSSLSISSESEETLVNRDTTSANRSVRFSCSEGPTRCNSVKTACSTHTPTPFASPQDSLNSLHIEGEVDPEQTPRAVTPSEDGDGEATARAFSAPRHPIACPSQGPVYRSLSAFTLPTKTRKLKKTLPVTLSTNNGLFTLLIQTLLQLITAKLDDVLVFSEAIKGVKVFKISATSTNFLAKQMMRLVSARLNCHGISSCKSSPEQERKLEAKLGPIAAEVIKVIIRSILTARARGTDGQTPRASSPVSYFLSAICAEVQSLQVQRSGSRLSAGNSLSHLMLSTSRINIVRAVEKQMEEGFGKLQDQTLPVLKLDQSQSQDFLGYTKQEKHHPGRFLFNPRFTALSRDVVDVVLEHVAAALRDLENKLSSRPGSGSSFSGHDTVDVCAVAKKMAFNASAKLTLLVSDGMKVKDSSNTPPNMATETLFPDLNLSELRLLCVRSVEAVSTACRAISSEIISQRTITGGMANLKMMAASEIMTCLSETVDHLEIQEIIQGTSAILNLSAVIQHPEMCSTAIYRSLFVETTLSPQSNRNSEIMETVIITRPKTQTTKKDTAQEQQSLTEEGLTLQKNMMDEYMAKAKDIVEKTIKEAVISLSIPSPTPSTLTLEGTFPSLPVVDCPSDCVSTMNVIESFDNFFDGLLVDLYEVVERHKVLAGTGSGHRMVWEQVHSSSQQLYEKVLKRLRHFSSVERLIPLETPTANPTAIASPQESFSSRPKNTLRRILSAIRSAVTESKSPSVAVQEDTEDVMLACGLVDSILQSLDQLPDDDECQSASSSGLDGIDANIQLPPNIIKSATEDLVSNIQKRLRQLNICQEVPAKTAHCYMSESMLPATSMNKFICSFAQSSVGSVQEQCQTLHFKTSCTQSYSETVDLVAQTMTTQVMDNLRNNVSKSPLRSMDEELLGCESNPTANNQYIDSIQGVETESSTLVGYSDKPCSADIPHTKPDTPPAGRRNKKRLKRAFKSCCLPQMIKFPNIKIKVFKSRTDSNRHRAQEELPTKKICSTQNLQETLHVAPSTSANEELHQEEAANPKPKACPFLVRMFQAFRKTITRPFKRASV